jgi:uncharacterized delta-60 repeat protein
MDLGMGDESISSVALQADGKIVLAGSKGTDPDYDFLLLRLNANGTLDSSFGLNGIVLPPSSAGRDALQSVAVQSDGKIVTAGQYYNGSHWDVFIARYLSDGSPDNTFGIGGSQVTDCGTGSRDYGRSLAIAVDGKLVVGGTKKNGTLSDFLVVRYNQDGTLDNTFGGSGIVVTDLGSNADEGYSLVINPDNKVLLSGRTGSTSVLGMVRYDPDGSLDASFGNNGKVVMSSGNGPSLWQAVALQDTDRIIVAGSSDTGPTTDFAVARYLNNGTLDNSFGINGITVTDLYTKSDQATSTAIQFGTKILVAGYSGTQSNGTGISVARYISDLDVGLLDQATDLPPIIYPNPIHAFVTIRYELPESELVSVRLLDINGQMIYNLTEDVLQLGGEKTIQLTLPKELVAGMYLIDIQSESGSVVARIVKD